MRQSILNRVFKRLTYAILATIICAGSPAQAIDISGGVSLGVQQITRTLGGQNITFWVYCIMGSTAPGGCMNPTLPGPLLELGVGAQANVSLTVNPMMANEAPPYDGHTIHFHGLDVPQSEDGVPETGAPTDGDTYTFSVDSRFVGGHMYHCHVHTVKHLEMGMYGPFVVRAVDGNGAFLPTINEGGPSYDFEWNMVLSTVDPRYHTAVGDDPVFASYIPQFFLINGNEGPNRANPADTLTATAGANVAIRLMGLQGVNATFRILDQNNVAQLFTLHNIDGFALNTPQSITEIELSPGQTKDLMLTLPATAGELYPEVTYRRLRNDSPYSTVYTTLTFN
jgi:FtsP/CotA-like multicopper oxidase with cupredoxin domain